MLPFEFTRPTLMILILPIAIVLGIWFVRSLTDFPRPQRIASFIARSILGLLLVLSLAGLTWLHRTHEKFVLFLVDQSLSVGENAETAAGDYLKNVAEKKGNDRVAYMPFAASIGNVQEEAVVFGAMPSILGRPQDSAAGTEATALRADAQPLAENDNAKRDGTNLAAAIEAAAGYMPPGYAPHIVVLTDGNQPKATPLLLRREVAYRSRRFLCQHERNRKFRFPKLMFRQKFAKVSRSSWM